MTKKQKEKEKRGKRMQKVKEAIKAEHLRQRRIHHPVGKLCIELTEKRAVCRRERKMLRGNETYKNVDLTGRVFGRLTAVSRAVSKRGTSYWLCQCKCGKETVVVVSSLVNGNTRSCGCYKREVVSLPKGVAALNHLVRRIKSGAKRRNLTWELTNEQVKSVIIQPCYYCGIKPVLSRNPNGIKDMFAHNGLDRWDSTLGYTVSNVVASCKICNWAKRNMPPEEFESWGIRLGENLKSGRFEKRVR